jgi:5-methylcytosine-specific restriction endonuclease McrA
MEYSEKLRSPKWQKKRLDIMSRDNWRCRLCGNTEETLVVHHSVYEKGREPWDYGSNQLISLCETCHKKHHETEITGEDAEERILKKYMKKISGENANG